jgi:hypothetical protein
MSVLFLYAYRPADRNSKFISETLVKIQASPDFVLEDVTLKTRSEVMKIISTRKPARLILNGHGSGTLTFFTGKDKFNFQEKIPNDETPIPFVPFLEEAGVNDLMILSCHAGQFEQDWTKIQVFTISTEYTLSFANYAKIMDALVKDPSDWSVVKSVKDVGGEYVTLKAAALARTRKFKFDAADAQKYDSLIGLEAFVDVDVEELSYS